MQQRGFRFVLALAAVLGAGAARAATLASDQAVSSEGYYQLVWEAEEPVRLVESTTPAFADAVTLYQGSDSAHVVSGKPDGTWYYRIEAASGAGVLADPVSVTVSHHSLGRAFGFFALGAFVFVSTLALILLARPEAQEHGS